MTLLLCALLACCGPVATDVVRWHDSAIALAEYQAKADLERLQYEISTDCIVGNIQEADDRPALPGLWEYRCEVDTVFSEIIHGGWQGEELFVCTIDTTCVWERLSGTTKFEYFDTYHPWHDPDFRPGFNQDRGDTVQLFREVKR